jgi:hypothetical protein
MIFRQIDRELLILTTTFIPIHLVKPIATKDASTKVFDSGECGTSVTP